jgi:hypothetical protein
MNGALERANEVAVIYSKAASTNCNENLQDLPIEIRNGDIPKTNQEY